MKQPSRISARIARYLGLCVISGPIVSSSLTRNVPASSPSRITPASSASPPAPVMTSARIAADRAASLSR